MLENLSCDVVYKKGKEKLKVDSKESVGNEMRCEVCGVDVYGDRNYKQHLNGKKHRLKLQEKLKGDQIPSCTSVDAVPRGTSTKNMEGIPVLAPGEPVPPGFEDVLNSVSQIQEELDAHKSSPLIGLEYLIEASVDDDPNKLEYFCLLCDKTGAKRIVISHLTSFNHQMKYLKLYFPSVHNYLQRVNEDPESKKVLSKIINGISSKIEQQFGRLKPLAVEKQSFIGKKNYYFEKISSEAHFKETPEIDLKEVVDVSLPGGNKDEAKPTETRVLKQSSSQEVTKERSLFHKSKVNVDKTKLRSYKSVDDSSDNKSLSEKESLQGDLKAKKMNDEKEGSDDSSVLFCDKSKTSANGGSIMKSDKIYDLPKKREESFSSRLSNISSVSSRSRSWSRSLSKSPDFHSRRSKNLFTTSSSPLNSRKSSSRSPNKRYGRARPRSKSPKRKSSSDYRRLDRRSSDRGGQHQSRPQHSRDEKNNWEKFRAEADAIEAEMAANRKHFEKNPEKHPAYASEWKKYCNHRIDNYKGNRVVEPRSHEFKLEWIAYWKDRMSELYDKELRARKDALKKKLGLPEERPLSYYAGRKRKIHRENSYPLEDEHKVPHHEKKDEKKSPPKTQRLTSPEKLVTVSDVKSTWKALTGNDIGSNPEAKQRKENNATESTLFTSISNEVRENKYSTGLIATLRLVTALEDQLGSLGPKVNFLLSQALALQRRGSSADSLLLSSENVILVETVKEKLIGHLQVGIVRRSMVTAVKHAIQTIKDLLTGISSPEEVIVSSDVNDSPKCDIPFTSTSGGNNELSEVAECSPKAPVPVPGIGVVDKVAIAQQIALVLVEQGRTDVSEQELQILVDRCIGMAQAQAQSEVDNTRATAVSNTASILSDLAVSAAHNYSVNVSSPVNVSNLCFNTCSRTVSESRFDISCAQGSKSISPFKAQEPPTKNVVYPINKYPKSEPASQAEHYSQRKPFEHAQFHVNNSILPANAYNRNTSDENCESIIKYPLSSYGNQHSVRSSQLNSGNGKPVVSGNYVQNRSNYYLTGYQGSSS